MPRLDIPELAGEGFATFETYKQCPGLLRNQIAVPLPDNDGTSAPRRSFSTPIGVADAEAHRRALASNILPLFGGAVIALPVGENIITVASAGPSSASPEARVACGAGVVSMVSVGAGSDRQDALVVVSTAAGSLAVLAVSSCGNARLLCTTAALPLSSNQAADKSGGDVAGAVFVSAAAEIADGRFLLILVHRAVKDARPGLPSRIEVSALRLHFPPVGQTEVPTLPVELLGTLRGPQPPTGACWFGHGEALLAAEAGFEVVGAESVDAMDCSIADGAALTSLRVPLDGSSAPVEVECWALARGDLLAAWQTDAGVGAIVAQRRLALVLSDGSHGVRVLHAAVPERCADVAKASDLGSALSKPELVAIGDIPGLGACASARSQLQSLLVSPGCTFSALMESCGQNAVAVFRSPSVGAARSGTASPDLCCGGAGVEVWAMGFTDDALWIRTPQHLVRCDLDASVRVEGAAPPLAPRIELPMGVDPKALLHMLDMRGED
eukprot:TRINITY_DN26919_c0_g1_i1.p1 TRINITY_DN26919_c0_g1~~TRINITY_DN26919_c0_g1_i1.p1  ORF type:complete len:498 (+),score=95.94 TRINITY_DN26919_c0_g1_i1:155-1648(+)